MNKTILFRNRVYLMLLIAVCIALAGGWLFPHRKTSTVNAAAKSPAGFWLGTGTVKRSLNLKVANLKQTYQSSFWFILDEKGIVTDGHAVVIYDMNLDDDVFRGLVSQANSLFKTGADKFGGMSKIAGVSELMGSAPFNNDLVGMRSSYDEQMPSREGKIKGSLQNGVLTLAWETEPSQVPFKTMAVYAVKEQLVKQSNAPAYSPWLVNAAAKEVAPGQWEAYVPPGQGKRDIQNLTSTIFWTAYKVSQ